MLPNDDNDGGMLGESDCDGDGARAEDELGDKSEILCCTYNDSWTPFTLPNTEWLSPRFFPSGFPINWAICFNLSGKRSLLPSNTDATIVAGASTEEPIPFLNCKYIFCKYGN
jgi:hypothetical protein